MAKMTLLQMVQNILSDLNSDEVNSITDTVEATQIAETIKSVYYDLINDTNYPEHYSIGKLTALGDTSLPNYMLIPTDVKKIKWLKYNNATTSVPAINYIEVKYLCQEEFINKILSRDSEADNIDTISDTSGVSLLIQNDKMPEFYTSFDDEYLIFDSYDSNEQTSLTEDRSLIFCSREPTFTLSNSFIPDLDGQMFPLLLAEAKSLAFINNTQASNSKVEQIAKRHRSRSQGRLHRLSAAERIDTPNYGRRK